MSQLPLKFKQVTDLSVAIDFTTFLDSTLVVGGTLDKSVGFVYIQAEAQGIRWRDDGTAPTASVGQVLAAGNTLVLTRGQLSLFKMIQQTAGAIANVTPYKNC